MTNPSEPALNKSQSHDEAMVRARAALRMLAEGELDQARNLFAQALAFARQAD